MGNSVSAAISKAEDGQKKDAQDSLNALLAMAEMKYQTFLSSVKDKSDTTMVPVSKFLLMDHSVNASVKKDNEKVKKAVTGAVSAFASGAILDGVSAVIGFGIDAVLGNVAANQSEHTTYVITCGELGGLMRIDINIFCYSYTSESLRKIAENVVSVSYAISSVDSRDLDPDTLRGVVQVCYGGVVKREQLNEIYQLLIKAHESSKTGRLEWVPEVKPAPETPAVNNDPVVATAGVTSA
ncbi:hypothetical protein MIND_01156100 [Mycena indigotica]|uniref:Uncharacterized protein n=1 Tax=Mycena indigotica TaxID=2126181 RepID=A0A8H6S5S4_9AGAR|nr:uncharacterized protein MIND_01156100 [Mycena indigotica]KAF7292586.1 hypothetical protein MIND_01156100 [Mycena indigotica]